MRSICNERTTVIILISLALLLSIQSLLSWQAIAQDTVSGPRSLKIQLPKIFDWTRYKVSGKVINII